jgi:hypothetical protein
MRKPKSCADHATLAEVLTGRAVTYPNIDAVIKDGVNVGVVGDCVASASTSYECLVMLAATPKPSLPCSTPIEAPISSITNPADPEDESLPAQHMRPK